MPDRPVGSCAVTDGSCGHYSCALRSKGVQVPASATPTKTLNMIPNQIAPATRTNLVYDERPGGIKMPILREDGSVVRQKSYDENRRDITATMRRLRSGQEVSG